MWKIKVYLHSSILLFLELDFGSSDMQTHK